jgi:hypothetical protein
LESLFGRDGSVVGWLHTDDIIIDGSSQCRAFLHDGSVYSLKGEYLGEFQNGFFWDQSGMAVAFVRDASGGPEKPVMKLPGFPPLVRVPRLRLFPKAPGLRPSVRREWSGRSFTSFLEGQRTDVGAPASQSSPTRPPTPSAPAPRLAEALRGFGDDDLYAWRFRS